MIDLRSDTVTRPSPGMWEAMSHAELGDDVFGDDPTVNRLQEVAARLLGKEDALFVPSGTMGNEVAIHGHTRPGDRILVAADAHVIAHETGAPAVISGVLVESIPARRGILDPDCIVAAIPAPDIHVAAPSLLCVENTSNSGGGSVYPLQTLDALAALARDRGLRTHMDGARIFNAQVASGIPAARIARGWDSVTFCLSKGLGCPVGSVLCGTRAWIAHARRIRKMLGGGMRQVGILAAAGLYALEHHVDRLAEDHVRARRLYEGLRSQGWGAEQSETNMVYLQVPNALALADALMEAGVACCALAPDRLRLVTHLDLGDADVEEAIAIFGKLRCR
jgi:threonine aldolase